jgi:hypothetical protein
MLHFPSLGVGQLLRTIVGVASTVTSTVAVGSAVAVGVGAAPCPPPQANPDSSRILRDTMPAKDLIFTLLLHAVFLCGKHTSEVVVCQLADSLVGHSKCDYDILYAILEGEL